MSGEYSDLIDQLGHAEDAWAEKFYVSMRTQVLRSALFAEAFKAAVAARKKGHLVDLKEWSTSETFELAFRGRSVRFSRRPGSSAIDVLRDGFPFDVVPLEKRSDAIAAPEHPGSAPEVATDAIRAALSLLIQPG